jgi:hypothetical protein
MCAISADPWAMPEEFRETHERDLAAFRERFAQYWKSAEPIAAGAGASPDGWRVGLEFHFANGEIVRVSLPANFAANVFFDQLVWAIRRCKALQASQEPAEGAKPN